MKTISPIIVIAFVLGGCAVNSGVVATSADTFSVSRQAATGFTGLAGLYPEAVKEASEQCSKMGKQYVELNRSSSRPPYIAGNFPRVEIQFRCGQVGPSNAEKCFSDIANDPSLAGIKDKVALARVDDQTFTMLTDKSTPTTDEKALLKKWGNQRDACIKISRTDNLAERVPAPIANLNNAYASAAQFLIADLINGDLTYSSYADKRQKQSTLITDTAHKINAELRKNAQDSNFKAEQLALEAQRNSLMEQKIYSDKDMQQQQIRSNEKINSQNNHKTTTTNCRQNGGHVTCTTN